MVPKRPAEPAATAAGGERRPNVLLLMADQQRVDTLDPQGPCHTPNLDALAGRGVRFTRALTPNAICSPSRASMMTGLYPSRHGMVDCTHAVADYRASLREGLPMWSQRLHDAGYAGGYFGKWHVERSNLLERFGFDEYVHHHSDEYRDYRREQGVAKTPAFSHRLLLQHPGYRDYMLYGVHEDPLEATEPYYLYSRGIDFVQRHAGAAQPWCCVVSTLDPHDPFVVPRAYYDQYDPDTFSVPASYDDDPRDRPALQRRLRSVWRDVQPHHIREAMACYYASCTFLDVQVGRILTALDETGQRDHTLVIYTTDHGEMLGAHGLFLKGATPYKEVYNIPLVVAGAGVRAPGRTCAAYVNHVDMAPTLLELTGSAPIADVDGCSLGPLLRAEVDHTAETATPWDEGYAEFHGTRLNYTQRIVWWQRWKYVYNGFDIDELYNLADDPQEQRNLAGEPEQRAMLEAMAARMWRRVHALGDFNLANAQYPMYRFSPVGPLAGHAGSESNSDAGLARAVDAADG